MKGMTLGVLAMLAATTNVYSQDPQPLNVAEWRSAQEILKLARNKIEKGWAQGFIDPAGMPSIYCVSTGMETSFLELKKSIVDFDYAKLALNKAINAPDRLPTSGDDPLSVPYWGRYYVYWNDAPGRTKEEVVSAFDRAIAYAEDQRNAAVKAGKNDADLTNYDKNSMQILGLGSK